MSNKNQTATSVAREKLILTLSRVRLGAAVLCAAPFMAAAQPLQPSALEEMGRPLYIAPMASFIIDDSDRATKNGYGASLALGTRVLPWLAVEGYAAYARFNDADDQFEGVNTNGNAYGANALVFPFSGGLKNLFGLVGAAYNDVRRHPFTVGGNTTFADYDSEIYEAGVGYLASFRLFGNPAAMRIETKYRYDDHGIDTLGAGGTDDFGDVVISTGLMVPLFYQEPPPPPPPPAPEVVPVSAPADSDNDGVADTLDQCPNTPAGVEVDDTGCPVQQCKLGGDNGIELAGCKAGDVVILRGVNFEFDSDRLTPTATELLDKVAVAMERAPAIAVEVGGHTDSLGAEAYNQRLSERRATAVARYLTDAGIAAERLSTAGYGETRPVADNDDEAGRDANRRVELTVR